MSYQPSTGYRGHGYGGWQTFFTVGQREFHWFWDNAASRPAGSTGVTVGEAFAAAKAESERTGLRIETWKRQRMNDYVGSPRWGNYEPVDAEGVERIAREVAAERKLIP